VNIWLAVICIVLLGQAGMATAQCAPGIPSAGNPGCIPPNQANSPYYQGQQDDVSPQQAAPQWAEGWGAIALDFGHGSHGTSAQSDTKSSAATAALSDCRRNGGTQCEVVITFVNQCAAISQPLGGGDISSATAATSDAAEQRSISRCGDAEKCKVFVEECSAPVRVN
jgi:hypothetical protein